MSAPIRTTTPANHYLTTEEAAGFLRVSPRYLEALRRTGGGPAYFSPSPGRVVRYARLDLEGWAESHKRRSTSDLGRA